MTVRHRTVSVALAALGALAVPVVLHLAPPATAAVPPAAGAVSPAAASPLAGAVSPAGAAPARPAADGSRLARLIEDVTAADGHRYGARDSAGSTMDTAKVIDNPAGGYLAVYHTGRTVKLATSEDLVSWRFRRDLDRAGTQPTVVATSDGGFVLAFETETRDNGHVKLVHYRDLGALYAGQPNRTFTAPRTLSKCNEGTPSISSVRLDPDIDHSVIILGMHYHQNCDTDREATGRLTNFRQWRAAADPTTNNALVKAAATLGKTIGGNIGDRDSIVFGSRQYSLNEVQYVKGRFGTWRTYLFDHGSGKAEPLAIKTHGGSKAFANPTFTQVDAPGGGRAIVVTMFLPGEEAAPGEGGELIYYRKLPPA